MRLLLVLLVAAAVWAGEPTRLIVLHTNDLHGQLEPLAASSRAGDRRETGGFAHLAALVRAARREAEAAGAHLLLLDAGDFFQGTPIGNETRGESVVEAMNALAYDAATVGNHEFDYGLANLVRLVERSRFPVLAANVAGVPGVRPYVVFAPPRVPCRIAVVGLLTTWTPRITTPGATGDARFADPAETLRGLLREIEADLVIALTHLGQEDDRALVRAVPGIDLLVGGHSHTPMDERIGTTTVVQANARGLSLGRVDLDLDPDGWAILRAEAKRLPVDPASTPPDAAVQAVVERYGAHLHKRLAEAVGELTAPLERVRGHAPSTAGRWMADVIRRAGKADVGFMNKGGIRCDLPAGPVTVGDVYRLMPFDNTVVAMDLSGAELRQLLERNFEGGIPPLEWSGLTAEVERTDEGWRLAALRVGDEDVDDARTYRVATNSFLAGGGDGHTAFRAGRRVTSGTGLVRDALAEDLRARSPLTPPADRRLLVREPAR